jgi:hypothetical protein
MWTDVMGYRRGKAMPCPYTGTQLKWKRYSIIECLANYKFLFVQSARLVNIG